MKLYDIPRESKIKVECLDKKGKKIGDWITFHHLDGMYSLCTIDGQKEPKYVHLSASTPLRKVKDGKVVFYEIDEKADKDVC